MGTINKTIQTVILATTVALMTGCSLPEDEIFTIQDGSFEDSYQLSEDAYFKQEDIHYKYRAIDKNGQPRKNVYIYAEITRAAEEGKASAVDHRGKKTGADGYSEMKYRAKKNYPAGIYSYDVCAEKDGVTLGCIRNRKFRILDASLDDLLTESDARNLPRCPVADVVKFDENSYDCFNDSNPTVDKSLSISFTGHVDIDQQIKKTVKLIVTGPDGKGRSPGKTVNAHDMATVSYRSKNNWAAGQHFYRLCGHAGKELISCQYGTFNMQ